MELVTLKIKPLSPFRTIPKGDTLFSHIVAYDFLEGGNNFTDYLHNDPKIIVSDMLPFGYVYRPTLPLEYFKRPNEKDIDKKTIRKNKFITIDALQRGELYKCQNIEYKKNVSYIHNSVNRKSFLTDGEDFAPYGEAETVYHRNLWVILLVDENIKDRVLYLISKVGKYGFGKDSSIGKGCFEYEIIKDSFKQIDTEYYMSLSPSIIKDDNIIDIWYDLFTRFGKFGLDKAHSNAFKKPVIMADSGAVVKLNKQKRYFGKSIDNGNDKPSFLQGYSIALPIKIGDLHA